MRYITILYLFITSALSAQVPALVVTGCCDPLNIQYNVTGDAQLVLLKDRHERIRQISGSGTYNAYLVDAVELRKGKNVIARHDISPQCCVRRYEVRDNKFIYFLAPGRYTIHQRMGWTLDTYWKLHRKKEYTEGQSTWLGTGIFIVTWSHPNNSTYYTDVIRIY